MSGDDKNTDKGGDLKTDLVLRKDTSAGEAAGRALEPVERGYWTGVLARAISFSTTATEEAVMLERTAREGALKAKISLAETIEKAFEAENRLNFIKENREALSLRQQQRLAEEFQLKHERALLDLATEAANIKKETNVLALQEAEHKNIGGSKEPGWLRLVNGYEEEIAAMTQMRNTEIAKIEASDVPGADKTRQTALIEGAYELIHRKVTADHADNVHKYLKGKSRG